MPDSHEYRFGAFRLDAHQRALFRGGNLVPLAPKLLETLIFLVERHGRIVDKQDLMDAVWRGLVVEEVGLAKNVSALRKILATDGDGRTYIETVPKRGYRFVAAVTETLGPASTALQSVDSGSAAAEAPIDPADQLHPPSSNGTESTGAPGTPSLPGKRWTRQRVAQLTAAILAVIAGLLLWQRIGIREPISPRRVMLAVLPVQNLTGDPGREYISDGMTEELITQLGSLDPERVGIIARTSSMLYKKTTKTVAEIGRELGVDYVLEGSLRANAQRTRFSAQLVRTKDQSHLWAQDYDRDSQNLLALEDEIGRTVAKEIGFRLTAQSPKRDERRRALSPESHEAYLLGRYYWNQGDEPSLHRSIELYRGAIEKDPQNALAYAGLADAYSGFSDLYLPPRAVMPEAKAAALNALRLDDSLSAAHNALCVVLTNYEWNWSAAERECRRAIELNPNSSDAHDTYAYLLAYVGRAAEAAAEIRRAEELDPLSFRIYCDGAFAAYLARDYPLAEEQAKRSLDLGPDYFLMHSYLALIYVQMHQNSQAVEEAQKAVQLTSSPLIEGFLGYVYAATGQAAEARRTIDEMKRLRTRGYACAFEIGTTELSLGNTDEAFRWFESAYDDRSLCITSMKFDPRLDSVHADPRYQNLIRRVGFP